MTLREIYSDFDESLNINGDDTIFDYRYYYRLLINQREIDLRQEYNRARTFNKFTLEYLNCFPMEIADTSTCCSDLFSTGCKILKSVNELPTPIEFHQQDGIRSIRPNNILAKPVTLIDSERVPYIVDDGINSNQIYAFIWNKYLYLYSLNKNYLLIDSVTIYGLFVDPVLASELGCSEGHCLTEDMEFPIPVWLYEQRTKPQILAKLLAKQYKQKDETNNSQDDSATQQLNIKK
jgi:hypothetical protein